MATLPDYNVFLDLGDSELNSLYTEALVKVGVKAISASNNYSDQDFLASVSAMTPTVCVNFWHGEKSCAIIRERQRDFPLAKVVVVDFLADDTKLPVMKISGASGLVPLLGLSPATFFKRLQTIVTNS